MHSRGLEDNEDLYGRYTNEDIRKSFEENEMRGIQRYRPLQERDTFDDLD